jgi:hypothetical protein
MRWKTLFGVAIRVLKLVKANLSPLRLQPYTWNPVRIQRLFVIDLHKFIQKAFSFSKELKLSRYSKITEALLLSLAEIQVS